MEKNAENDARAPSHAKKLKNRTSAEQAAGRKFRNGRKTSELTPEEKKQIQKSLDAHKRAAVRHAVSVEGHRKISDANEDDNVGTEALNRGTEAAETGVRAAGNHAYSRKLKHIDNNADVATDAAFVHDSGAASETGAVNFGGSAARSSTYSEKLGSTAKAANQKAVKSEGTSSTASAQKRFMRKEFQEAAFKKSEEEAANSIGSLMKKFVDQAEDFGGKIGEWLAEHLGDHPMAWIVALMILVIALIVGGGASGGGLLSNLFSGGTVASSYTAEDPDILTVDQNYTDLETDLREKIDHIESDHPGYDEYRYSLAEIGHDPYQLAALLTVLYEDYTPEEVQEKLQDIFGQQYTLKLDPVTEIRTRTETRTGHRTKHHSDGTTSRESYEYEVEIQYEYHILYVTLENSSMAEVIRNAGLTDDQMERYNLLAETYGNKKYLFGEDIYSNPDADAGGSSGNTGGSSGGSVGEVSGPSGEALTDTEFAAMWQEAKKYLGRAYVWGGSSPSTGFDCSGYVCWVINHSGVGSIGRTTAEGIRQWCRRIPKSERKPGDIIFFQGTYNTTGASHVGIYIGDGKMIHCGDPIKISNVDSGYFAQHFLSYGRIPD